MDLLIIIKCLHKPQIYFFLWLFIQELNKCAVWCIDGTFDVVSGLYAQRLTIHGVSSQGGSNFIFPLVLVLLPDKRYCTYKYVYEQLRTSPYHVDPEMV